MVGSNGLTSFAMDGSCVVAAGWLAPTMGLPRSRWTDRRVHPAAASSNRCANLLPPGGAPYFLPVTQVGESARKPNGSNSRRDKN